MHEEYIRILLERLKSAEGTNKIDCFQIDILTKYVIPLPDEEKIEFARGAFVAGPKYYDSALWVLINMLSDGAKEPWYSQALDILVFTIYINELHDYKSGIETFREYGDNNGIDSSLQYKMGEYYSTGYKGFPKDSDKARYWLELAAERGNEDAIKILNIGI